jgi:hypothetical protein
VDSGICEKITITVFFTDYGAWVSCDPILFRHMSRCHSIHLVVQEQHVNASSDKTLIVLVVCQTSQKKLRPLCRKIKLIVKTIFLKPP